MRQRRPAAADPDEAALREEEPEVGSVHRSAPAQARRLPEEAEALGGARLPSEADPEDEGQGARPPQRGRQHSRHRDGQAQAVCAQAEAQVWVCRQPHLDGHRSG